MTGLARITLTAPFILLIIEYLDFSVLLLSNPEIDPYWQNHGLREALYAVIVSAVVLNLIWSTVDPKKLKRIGLFGGPAIFGFWIFNAIVGFGATPDPRELFLLHLAQAVTFVVGYLMVASIQSKPKR